MPGATLRQVAERAGVSVSLVSRMLSRRPDHRSRCSEETRARILAAARELCYRPNRAAEFLKRGAVPSIGVFVPDWANRLVADLVIGLSESASEEGFPLSLVFSTEAAAYRRFLAARENQAHCGIITYVERPALHAELREFRDIRGSLLLLNTPLTPEGIPTLNIDGEAGGRLAAGRLLERGCGDFLAIGRPILGRVEGFQAAVGEAGRAASFIRNIDDGIAALRKRIDRKGRTKPIGVFTTTDRKALRVIRALADGPARVGRDILLVGYDDLDLAGDMTPALTTVHQPFREQGQIAVRKIMRMIYGGAEASEKIVPRLVIRETA